VVVTYFKGVFQHFPEGTEEIHKKTLVQDSLPSDQELNPGPPEYEQLPVKLVMYSHTLSYNSELDFA
jgi:hypothetical protein